MTIITGIEGLEILDSRCRPTVEAVVRLEGGAAGRASVPSGASTGQHEALELRDGDEQRYGGFGVLGAVAHVNRDIADALIGLDAEDQTAIDDRLCALDGTDNKSRLGGNATLAVSAACARAAAGTKAQPLWRHFAELARRAGVSGEPSLPLSMINLLSGGKHAGGRVDFQDFLIVPVGANTVDEVTLIAYRVWYACRTILQEEGRYTQLVADEGGLGPDLDSNEAMMRLAIRAIERAGCVPGQDVSLAIDVAASHFHDDGRYALANENRQLSPDEMIDRLAEWVRTYPLISIEDGLDENDWAGWKAMTDRLGAVQLLGDDLFTTDTTPSPTRHRSGGGQFDSHQTEPDWHDH